MDISAGTIFTNFERKIDGHLVAIFVVIFLTSSLRQSPPHQISSRCLPIISQLVA